MGKCVWRPPPSVWWIMSTSWALLLSARWWKPNGTSLSSKPEPALVRERWTQWPLDLDGLTASQHCQVTKRLDSRERRRRWNKRQSEGGRVTMKWWEEVESFRRQKKESQGNRRRNHRWKRNVRKDGRGQTNGGGKAGEIKRVRQRSSE